MVQYWFEIFRQTYDRWSWHFVELTPDGRRRVLARSGRDYGSRKRARKAVRAFTEVLEGAQVMSGVGGFPLPASSFAVDYDVVPLMAGVSRPGYEPKRTRRRDRADEAPAQGETPAGEPAQAQAAPSEPEQAAQAVRAARETRPKSGRGSRKPKGS